MTADPRIEHYDWAGGHEAMLRFGPRDGRVAVVILPLFEEANRTRAVAVAMLRALAVRGVGGALPDLPGQGESLESTERLSLGALRESAAAAIAAAGERAYVVAIRSGALLDASAPALGRWHLSPQEGSAVVRELTRIKQQEVGRGHRLSECWYGDDAAVSVAGNLVSSRFLSELTTATLHDVPAVPRRTVRLDADPRPADRHLAGAPPWRRAEPGRDDRLAEALADDLADWIATCAGC